MSNPPTSFVFRKAPTGWIPSTSIDQYEGPDFPNPFFDRLRRKREMDDLRLENKRLRILKDILLDEIVKLKAHVAL